MAVRHNLDDIRRLIITAVFADDVLFDYLVLKGGNALSLVHRVGSRASLDLDFSMAGDFDDSREIAQRIFASLDRRLATASLVVFDKSFEAKPKLQEKDDDPTWGGYLISFKLIEKSKHFQLRSQPAKMQIDALPIGIGQQRIFRIEISKHEYVEGRQEEDLDHFTIRVYTPAMIAIEKLRALCQQLPEYQSIRRRRARARARDFYDIHAIVAQTSLDFSRPENLAVLTAVFAAKQVPLRFLSKLREQREYHRVDWPDVVGQVSGNLESFDFYFDFVIERIMRLEVLWD
jgi:predicted nucleotidyltransferase component of viral defense system